MRQIAGFGFVAGTAAADRVWLRTLILIRWLAICGQLAAISLADLWFGIALPLGLCLLAIGASVIVNLIVTFIFPGNRRLSETGALLSLLFDLCQLGFLVFVTGGLTNPFALLFIAPVTISASVLGIGPTLILGTASIAMVSGLAVVNIPITLAGGITLTIPRLFTFGFWAAIVVGIVFLGVYARRVARESRALSDALLATQMALAREQKLTDLGGVVAAAAHELGTPLATIKLVSAELMDELSDQPELLADARLIREQADRCRDILHDMGRAGKDDLQLRQAPLSTLLREAAEPHMNRGKELVFEPGPASSALREPMVRRSPETIHGLRNLIQNAVDFAAGHVWIQYDWSGDHIALRIVDDGPGYPPNVINRIGDPFVRSRRNEQDLSRRPAYEGMGLGLFIAKTLLERTGASLTFTNAHDPFLPDADRQERSGALVGVRWRKADLLASDIAPGAANAQIEI
ncbi:sensor histidine kinase RegB [Paracoccus sp. IB05]|uniref:sensor histidine kinase RegB n=1 Tax=Paracoccus sp. IB05 TaxID=2779367 RepID=UPI0018E90502|nr:ActS/PrrB/RegB family redox-sensitive histidine kinase [Paracoccus sp. IB05]MBJ2152370.1 ActS/PrrB/RegB family redox-sensitive histidine kinase [Paracoccus sp. IB05]